MKYEDEDMGYEMQRQEKLDAKCIIGSDLKDCDKIQKSVHRDPAPQLPFQEDEFKWDVVDVRIGWALVVVASLIMGITLWVAV